MINHFCHLCFLQRELLALQLPEKEVNEAISAQILPLIGQSQSRDEERLADLDVGHTHPHLSSLKQFLLSLNFIFQFIFQVFIWIESIFFFLVTFVCSCCVTRSPVTASHSAVVRLRCCEEPCCYGRLTCWVWRAGRTSWSSSWTSWGPHSDNACRWVPSSRVSDCSKSHSDGTWAGRSTSLKIIVSLCILYQVMLLRFG